MFGDVGERVKGIIDLSREATFVDREQEKKERSRWKVLREKEREREKRALIFSRGLKY